jgi:ABC-type xylose transport system permease subunit
MKGMNAQCSRGESCGARGQVMVILSPSQGAVPATPTLTLTALIEVGVTGHVETRTRDAGAQRGIAARKTKTHSGKETLAVVLVVAAVAAAADVVDVPVVVVVHVVAANETSQFQQDGSQLFGG